MLINAGDRITGGGLLVPSNTISAPTTSIAVGPTTSGSTELMDTTLGVYQFTAIGGVRYRARIAGLVGQPSATGDLFALRIRDSGSAATPTSSSTLVAECDWLSQGTGSAQRNDGSFDGTFLVSPAGGGTHTLGLFAVRINGTGSFTFLSGPSGTQPRELYVEALGIA